MKKVLLGISFVLICSISGVNAQTPSGVVIQYDGTGPNLVGLSHDINLYPGHPDLVAGAGTLDVHFIVTNNTGADGAWRITRKEISVPSTWTDQLCWPPSCYNTTDLLYTTPLNHTPTVYDGTSTANCSLGDLDAELKPRFTPDQAAAGFGHYRYYIDAAGTFVDSVDVKINFTMGVNAVKQSPIIKISPNPASEEVSISLGAQMNATIKVVDVLGKEVFSDVITNGSKSINLLDFKNGVYFVIVEGSDLKPITRKLIVRH